MINCRYPDDKYDRKWLPAPQSVSLFTNLVADTSMIDSSNIAEHPPLTVLETAVSIIGSTMVLLSTETTTKDYAYLVMYFTEMSELDSTEEIFCCSI